MKKLFSAENSSPFCRDKEKRKNCKKKKKGNPLNLDCSVAVLTLDVSLDVGANNCLLQLNALAEIELCVQRRPAHRADKEAASQMELTGLHRDEIFKVWLVDKLTRPSSSALSCPSSLPCQWPISKSRFHNLLLQTYCLVSIFGRAKNRYQEDMFWQHCSKFYEFVTQFGRSSFESAETCLRCTVVCPHPVSPPGWVSIIHKRWVANLKLITLMLFILHFKWTNT